MIIEHKKSVHLAKSEIFELFHKHCSDIAQFPDSNDSFYLVNAYTHNYRFYLIYQDESEYQDTVSLHNHQILEFCKLNNNHNIHNVRVYNFCSIVAGFILDINGEIETFD